VLITNKFNIKYILLLGILIRLVISPFTAHPFDMYVKVDYVNTLLVSDFNFSEIINTLRPLWFILLGITGNLYNYISIYFQVNSTQVADLPSIMNPHWGVTLIPHPLFNFIIKLPMIICDTIIAVVIYKLVFYYYKKPDISCKATYLFYLNPVVIWISSIWGQFDSIAVLFSLLSIYMMLKKKYSLSSLSLILGALFKWYILISFLPFVIYVIKKRNLSILLKFLTPIIFVSIIGTIIILWQNTIGLSVILQTFSPTHDLSGIFGFGLTYWSISLLYDIASYNLAIISLLVLLTFICLSLLSISKINIKNSFDFLIFANLLLIIAIFLAHRQITEPRFVWLVPFLSISVILKKINLRTYWALTLITILYMQKNFPYYLLPMNIININLIKPLFEISKNFGIISDGSLLGGKEIFHTSILLPNPFAASILAILGILFSIILLIIYSKYICKIFSKSIKSKV
tara:strand:- start:2411 stop:3790 length:1380 start_codon:yes stop_codon:yes gene_type:complete